MRRTPVSPTHPTAGTVGPWPDDRKLRAWQDRALKTIGRFTGESFLLEACPAAGKTIPGLRVAHEHLTAGRAQRALVLVPTVELAVQWAKEAAHIGLRIEPNWQSPALPRDCHGLAITYQRLAAMPELYRVACARERTVVIADEPHHMGQTAAWGQAYRLATEPAAFRLLLSGTPFRSDNDPIPGVRYDDSGQAQPDFAYTYSEAIRGRICRKIAFVHCDGELRWADHGTVIEATFVDALDDRQSRLRHRTAISATLDDGLTRMIRDANEQLTAVRRRGHDDAGGLIVACDIQHARDIARVVEREVGEPAVVVHSDDPTSTARIRRFRRSHDRWIVAVNMVSEGVDIPRLRVGVYAATVRTPLFFRQVIGRFVRTIPGKQADPSFLFLPADPALVRLAEEIEQEMRHQLTPTEETTPTVDRDAGADPDHFGFVPLDARLHAAETVMSGRRYRDPDEAAAIDLLAVRHQVAPEELLARMGIDSEPVLRVQPDESEFERRERLRRERKRLVGLLHYQTAREYREIQQEINEIVAGGRGIDDHTIAELEAAIRVLTRQLADAAARQQPHAA
jgi:superfamily II DNA or RNA helicase